MIVGECRGGMESSTNLNPACAGKFLLPNFGAAISKHGWERRETADVIKKHGFRKTQASWLRVSIHQDGISKRKNLAALAEVMAEISSRQRP